MMNDIKIGSGEHVGFGFVPQEFLQPGEDEYRIRNEQLRATGKALESYRKLKTFELETLVRNHNSCGDWTQFLVSDPFTPELVRNNSFAGLIRVGKLERRSLEHHDLQVFTGIADSQIVACDIGDNCVINDCAYLAHYIIGDSCILLDNDEIHVSNHSKFGSGILIEGEGEDVRITLDLMNEAGGRSVLPFDGITCADAYLWARNRGNARLMAAFRNMTESMFDRRRGRYGSIGKASVLKSNRVIKDVAIGESAYIKGSNKLKNLMINSSDDARTQIGEGVELVNGVIGYGCRIFYGCKAVRFVMGDNSALKYGARLIHSVLGENSTVSCCEILNNLIFPAHEQHHNTSFLIASLVKGQSNMAAGATIGSNHNSRAPDGEIEAGRGFWPGLSTSVKHSSRFASFCLLAKGDYRFELDIPLPFCLVDDDRTRDRLILVPAYWWTHNLYALMRNESKFKSRDGRRDKSIAFEYSPFAPDTATEIAHAMNLLEEWTGEALGGGREAGLAYLRADTERPDLEVLAPGVENADRPAVVIKPVRAWHAYREMLLWYAGETVIRFAAPLAPKPDRDALAKVLESAADSCTLDSWENLGGMLVAIPRLDELLEKTASGAVPTWYEMHAEYHRLSAAYALDKIRHAWSVLGALYPDCAEGHGCGPDDKGWAMALRDFSALTEKVERSVYESRAKDWNNKFRKATFRSEAELLAVMGKPEDNSFIRKTQAEMKQLRGLASGLNL
ncbi:MAG: DUF4954 family protein [Rectinemataceae bacterium]